MSLFTEKIKIIFYVSGQELEEIKYVNGMRNALRFAFDYMKNSDNPYSCAMFELPNGTFLKDVGLIL